MKNGNILPIISQPDIYILELKINNINKIKTINNFRGKKLTEVTELENKNLASLDYDLKQIQIWKKFNKNDNISYEEIHKIKENYIINDLIELKNNIIVYDLFEYKNNFSYGNEIYFYEKY